MHATRANVLRLLEVLDASGRLKLVKASELRPRLRNGVFALAKDECRDRTILDARAPNSVEDTENCWIRSLGSLEQLQFLFLPPDCNLETHTEDLKEFYHSFIITHQRCLRNALAAEFDYEQVKHLTCCTSDLEPPVLSVELARHGLQRGLWNRLLSPLQAFLRERGELLDGEELQADECYDSHPAWETLCRALKFRVLGPVRCTDRRTHINVGEVRAAVYGEERVGMRHANCRYLHLQDSQVALACFVKGRSCSPSINKELRRSLPFHLSSGVRPSFGFIRSRFNPSDDPTRSAALREPDIEVPDWLSEAATGSFEKFDAFLSECGMHPDQLAGLPDAAELLPDGPVDTRCPKAIRALRICRAPETLAKQLLELPHLAPSDGLMLFRRLPKEAAARDCKPRARSCSFSAGVFVVVGLRRYPASVQEAKPGFAFTSLSVNQNIETLPHVDSHNAAWEPNLILALNRFRRGGVWVEVQGGAKAIHCKGELRFGEVLSLQEGPKILDPKRLHATESWSGSRVVLIAYSVRSIEKLDKAGKEVAASLGFVLPGPGGIADTPCGSPRLLRSAQCRPPAAPQPSDLERRALAFGHRREPPNLCVGSLRVEPAFLPRASRPSHLSPAAFDFLCRLPPGCFLYSSVFPDLPTALHSDQGWLDLFSGFRGFGKSLVEVAPCWVLCLDTSHGADENLLRQELQDQLCWLVEEGAFKGFSASPPSGSFSAAVGSIYRDAEHPHGRLGLHAEAFAKVQNDNELLGFRLGLAALASERGMIYLIENPRNSWIWKQQAWQQEKFGDFFCDMCVFGTRWKKATRVRTNGTLQGKRLLCGCKQKHVALRGRDRRTGLMQARRQLSETVQLFACKCCCYGRWMAGRLPAA